MPTSKRNKDFSTAPSRFREKIVTNSQPLGMRFSSPIHCWDHDVSNKTVFRKYLGCENLNEYHDDKQGCNVFDSQINKLFAGDEYEQTMFLYYSVASAKGEPDEPRYIYDRLAGDTVRNADEILSLSRYVIAKKSKQDIKYIDNRPVPSIHNRWPDAFGWKHLNISTKRRKQNMANAISRCIKQRQHFRNSCVIPCSNKIKKQKSHDEFIIMLQILRAKIIVELSD